MRYFQNEYTEYTRKLSIRLAIVVGSFLLVLFLYEQIVAKPQEIKAFIKITNEINAITPLPQAREVYRKSIEKQELATSYIGYSTSLDFEEIRQYYNKQLLSLGWTFKSSKPIIVWGKDYGGKEQLYTKDNIELTLDYSGDDPQATATFDITLSWDYWKNN